MVQKQDHEERNMIGYNQYTQGYNKLFTQVIAIFKCSKNFSHAPEIDWRRAPRASRYASDRFPGGPNVNWI